MFMKNIDMINGSLPKNLLLFSIPVVLTNILALMFNACDIIVLGRFAGSSALAGVGATSSLISFLINIFLGLSIGINVLVAQSIGAQNHQKTERVVHTAVLFSIIIGIFVMFLGL